MPDHNKILVKALQLVIQYLEENSASDTPVVNYHNPELLRAKLDLSIPEEGISVDEFLSLLETYLTYSVRTGHKQFFNQLFSGFSLPGFLSDVFTSLTNTSMATYELAPLATLIEQELIQEINSLIGFNDGEGSFVTGGSNANLIAMLCARNKAFPKIKKQGIQLNNLTVFISDQAHYSFLKAANLLGIGQDNVIKVETDSYGRMIPQKLDTAIQDLESGKKPFFVGATAGTTVIGAFDPIIDIYESVRKHNLWLHIDGSWGGAVLLSNKYKHLLAGSELADSFSWDFHKTMGLPLICSVLLVKCKGTLYQACSSGDADYLFHNHENSAHDLGLISLQCGREVDSLKLWLSWQYHGKRGYEEKVNWLFEMAEYATQKVKDCPKLELVVPTQFLNICFRYIPPNQSDINQFNLELRDRLVKSGKSLVNYSYLNGEIIIRLIVVNFEINRVDIDQFFENFLKVGRELQENWADTNAAV